MLRICKPLGFAMWSFLDGQPSLQREALVETGSSHVQQSITSWQLFGLGEGRLQKLKMADPRWPQFKILASPQLCQKGLTGIIKRLFGTKCGKRAKKTVSLQTHCGGIGRGARTVSDFDTAWHLSVGEWCGEWKSSLLFREFSAPSSPHGRKGRKSGSCR